MGVKFTISSYCLVRDNEESLGSTRLRLFDDPKLFSFFLPSPSLCWSCPGLFCNSSISASFSLISSLYSLTAYAGSNASAAFSRNCFFHCCRLFGIISYLLATWLRVCSPSSSSKTTFVWNSAEN